MTGKRLTVEQARRWLEPLISLASDSERGVYLGDAEGRVQWSNEVGIQMSGFTRKELLGNPPRFRLLEPDHPEGVETELSPLDPDATDRRVLHIVDSEGRAAWIDFRVFWTGRKGDCPSGFAALASEVTRRKEAESALAESEERYHGLVDLCPDPIAVHDGEVLLYANLAATDLLGAGAPGELVGRPVMDIVHPDSRVLVAERIRKIQETGESMPLVEEKLCRLDGTPIEVEVVAGPIRWSGTPAVQLVVRDVSERHQRERERTRREAQLRESQHLDSLSRLSAGIAHDFNNTLATILGNADFVFSELSGPSRIREPLQEIRAAAVKANRLTEEILAFAEGGRLEPRPLDLSALLVEMSAFVDTAVPKKVAVSYDLSGQLPRVNADPIQLRRAFLNIILNASESVQGSTGTISVRATVRKVDAAFLSAARPESGLIPGRYVAVEIRDRGRGIDEQTRSRIFDPFFTTKSEGRGLGLPAALGVLRGHGGAIHIDSTPGVGTCVTLLLPFAASAPVRAREPALRSTELPPVSDFAGTTILLADDDGGVRRMAVRILERARFRVLTARDGTEAVAVFRRNAGHLGAAVLDLTMPGLSGDEVFEIIREAEPELPVLFSSGFSRRALSERVRGNTRTGFIAKPYEAQALIDSLVALLDEESG